jgi:peptide alpha-N-acetyltransferase
MDTITYRPYSGEHELPHIISLVQGELSEPYVVYTYRYFLHQWSVPLSILPRVAPG